MAKDLPPGLGELVEPAGRPAAPEPLRLVQQFINTHNHELEADRDRLLTPDRARTWLVGHHLLPRTGRVSERDHRRLLELRDALRALAIANSGRPTPRRHARVLEEVAGEAHFRIRFGRDVPDLVPGAGGVAGAMGRIVAEVYGAMAGGSWGRLKACRQCRWVFFDHSKNRTGAWCSMRICGNRIKNRAYRRRRA